MSVTPSPIGGFAAQFFDNNGVILSGGKIYTYAAGTTTPQASYTSASGTTPHANPIILDSAGRVPGGEIWLTDGLVYKFVIETATSILIGTYDNITGVNSNFVNYTVQEEVITATAGQTVFNLTTINYTPGTNSLTVYIDGVNQYVGDSYLETDSDTVTFTAGLHVGAEVKFTTAIQTTTGAVDASIVAYDPPFTGSVATDVEAKLAQYVSVKDFGAVGDGVTDDTAAIQAAVLAAATGSAGKKIIFPTATYQIDGTIYVPSNIDIDLCQSTLSGTGNTLSDNVIFNSGYLSGGAIISNFGPPEANRVVFTKIKNGTIENCNIAFNLQNFNEGCEISDIFFSECAQAVYAFRCFYGAFEKCTVRGANGPTETRAAFEFESYVNVQKIDSLFVIDRKLAFYLNGAASEGVDGTTISNCSAEDCEIGIQCLYSLRPLTIQGCYFERITDTAIDVSNASAQQVSVQGCWFGECVTGFKADTWGSGTFSDDNTWVDTSGTGKMVSIGLNTVAATGTVKIAPTAVANNGYPTLPSYYDLAGGVRVDAPQVIYNSSTGAVLARQNYTGGLIDLPYSGRVGASNGGVSFCQTSSSGGTTFDVYIDTKITFEDFTCGVFNLTIADDILSYRIFGRFYGTSVVEIDGTPVKTVTLANNGGFTRLIVSSFSHPAGTFSASGVVRHM